MVEIAEIVARVRVEDRDFKREMREAKDAVDGVNKGTTEGQRQTQRELNKTGIMLGQVKAGWLAAGAAAAGAGLFFGGSPSFQAHSKLVGTQMNLLAEQLYKGLDLDDYMRELARDIKGARSFLGDVGQGFQNARASDPFGTNNMFFGAIPALAQEMGFPGPINPIPPVAEAPPIHYTMSTRADSGGPIAPYPDFRMPTNGYDVDPNGKIIINVKMDDTERSYRKNAGGSYD